VTVEFTVQRPPRAVADEIEQLARAQGSLTALVVPWESSSGRLSMSVTSVKIDGWAIEHTNLGTITLTDAGGGTHVAASVSDDLDQAGNAKLATVFDQFARGIQRHLEQPRAVGTERR